MNGVDGLRLDGLCSVGIVQYVLLKYVSRWTEVRQGLVVVQICYWCRRTSVTTMDISGNEVLLDHSLRNREWREPGWPLSSCHALVAPAIAVQSALQQSG